MAYRVGKSATVVVNSLTSEVEDGSYDTSTDKDEITNLTTAGYFKQLATIKKANGSLQLVFNDANAPTFNEGDLITLVISGSGPGFSGTVFVDKMSYKNVSVKGAVKISFDWTSDGSYTKS